MAGFFSRLKDKIQTSGHEEHEGEEYVELNHEPLKDGQSKVTVRPFVIEEFEDIKIILDSLREGYTIGLVNIRPLKDKDLVELKRAINKLKKTCDAVDGDIAGFGDDWIVVTPSFAKVYRSSVTADIKNE
ncbi:MAG: cell division protein SepF [Nanoarchaeota archaeon]|nr:cell division protein SepF [Nanoarchaeota archaeon]